MVALATVLATALTGCDAVQEASDSVSQATDKVSICAEAVRLAGFQPDLSNPEQAAKDAQKASEDLARLAGQTADTTLQDALNGMSEKIGELNPANIDPAGVARWADEKATMVNTLARACG